MRYLTTIATLLLFTAAVHAKSSISLNGATVTVYFSPHGGADAAARLIDSARYRVMLAFECCPGISCNLL